MSGTAWERGVSGDAVPVLLRGRRWSRIPRRPPRCCLGRAEEEPRGARGGTGGVGASIQHPASPGHAVGGSWKRRHGSLPGIAPEEQRAVPLSAGVCQKTERVPE